MDQDDEDDFEVSGPNHMRTRSRIGRRWKIVIDWYVRTCWTTMNSCVRSFINPFMEKNLSVSMHGNLLVPFLGLASYIYYSWSSINELIKLHVNMIGKTRSTSGALSPALSKARA
jgi:hypothetical protein